jgi:hypothetical protein
MMFLMNSVLTLLLIFPFHTGVKATVGLGVHTEMLTKRSGPDGNEKGDVPLGNPTLPKDSTEIAESLA